jgi:phosphoribosyl-dephospho-CoA transferase
MQISETVSLQVHDLVQLDSDSLKPACIDAPNWVRQSLASSAWVVVRRAESETGQTAVGVRGSSRSQRWGCFINKDMVRKVVRPAELVALARSASCNLRTPALLSMYQLIERWCDLALPWGPTGSVGFELATGCPVTTSLSDLDVAIRAEDRISVEQARLLWERALGLQTKVDIRVETLECGFSLEEYVRAPSSILLRYPGRVQFGDDPWAKALKPTEGVE